MGLISNFPGGGKKPVGTASTKDVLSWKTFSNSEKVGVSGGLITVSFPEGRFTRHLDPWDSKGLCCRQQLELRLLRQRSLRGCGLTTVPWRVMTSPTASPWTSRTSAANNVGAPSATAMGLFVAVACLRHRQPRHDVPRRHHLDPPHPCRKQHWYSVCYGNGLFVAVASSGTGNRVMTSPDGITWTSLAPLPQTTVGAPSANNGLFVACLTPVSGNPRHDIPRRHHLDPPAPLPQTTLGAPSATATDSSWLWPAPAPTTAS